MSLEFYGECDAVRVSNSFIFGLSVVIRIDDVLRELCYYNIYRSTLTRWHLTRARDGTHL